MIEVEACLYPNPPLEGATLTDIWGNAYPMRNEPFLELALRGLSPGDYTVELLLPARLKRSFEASSSCEVLFFTHPAFADPGLAEVTARVRRVRSVEEFSLPLSTHKLTGRVRDFQGRPFPAYVWAVNDSDSPQAIVRTDEEGRFVLWYPEGKPLRVFIDDESYSKTTYECWIISPGLKADVRIEPRVGNLEVWGLHVWRTELHWHVYFWPCSLPLDLRAKRSGREFTAPRLKKEEITVRIDGEEVPILGLHQLKVRISGGRVHTAYLLDLPLHREGPHLCRPTLIQVEVHTATRGCGEGWYIAW